MFGHLAVVFFFCLLTMFGCNKNNDETSPPTGVKPAASAFEENPSSPAIPLKTIPLFSEPLETTVVETLNEALPIWRKHAKSRPFLAVLAQSPGLLPIPEEKKDEVRRLLKSGDETSLRLRTGLNTPDPVLLPQMSVGAALDSSWFEGIVWIFPTSASPESIDPDIFRQQLESSGFLSREEALAMTFQSGVFHGKIGNKTFIAAPLAALPTLDQPLLLHFDVDYFKTLYKGEIKTPLYSLLFQTMNSLKAKHLNVAEATVSLSNLGEDLPLQTRFIGRQIADILTDPEMLNQQMPKNWEERAQALHLENFMQKSNIRDIYLALEKEDSTDASIKFALYGIHRELNKPDIALDYLHEAVRLDPVYALEYLRLSEVAMQKSRPEKAVEMIRLADARLNSPFITLHLARTLINSGARAEALAVMNRLAAIEWSSTYYPNIKGEVDALNALLSN